MRSLGVFGSSVDLSLTPKTGSRQRAAGSLPLRRKPLIGVLADDRSLPAADFLRISSPKSHQELLSASEEVSGGETEP